jgi:hypothetical protein
MLPSDLVRKALLDAKFFIETHTPEGEEEEAARIRNQLVRALDLMSGPGNESNPLLVDTLSSSLANPFRDSEPPTEVVIKEKK